ncbi:hypothetical protein [Streptomyces chiangmaiensis]|uniref:Uncharacterized protein n=1 Tax=Streptomyces chiangmaiensis TaxID=766497 RepID=A0ABU7FB73_9ACTN|nr:hypothetical protein [Streptomyces chiangmaiensis]MED7821323.1 hypothetical protein [Streptomyces chiangmaiensis]
MSRAPYRAGRCERGTKQPVASPIVTVIRNFAPAEDPGTSTDAVRRFAQHLGGVDVRPGSWCRCSDPF